MIIDVVFEEVTNEFVADFGEVAEVSDGDYDKGYEKGYGEGAADGYDEGYGEGETAGYDKGYGEGETVGYNKGTSDGYANGYNQGNSDGYETGYTKGNSDGYAEGYETGYTEATEVKFTSGGMAYVEIKSVTVPYVGLGGSHTVWCTDCNPCGAEVFNQYGVLEGYAPELVHCSGHYPFTNSGNPLLRKIVAPKLKKIEGGYWGRNLKGLEFLQLGSIGHAVELLKSDSLGLRDTTDKLTIEVYVDAQTLADISPDITSQAPWSATSATIIYRNSTTGEVITE